MRTPAIQKLRSWNSCYRNNTLKHYVVEYQVALQVRLGSRRLPQKALLPLAGARVLDWVLSHLRQSQRVQRFLLLCPQSDCEAFAPYAERYGFALFGGAEHNVLERFCRALECYPCRYCFRATGDNPLLCGSLLDFMAERLEKQGHSADYYWIRGLPYGFAAELFRSEAIFQASSAHDLEGPDCEHVTRYLYRCPKKFVLHYEELQELWHSSNEVHLLSQLRVSLDTAQDYEFLQGLFYRLQTAGYLLPALSGFRYSFWDLLHGLLRLWKSCSIMEKPTKYKENIMKYWFRVILLVGAFSLIVAGSLPAQEAVVIRNRIHLEEAIGQRIAEYGNEADLNDLDISMIRDLSQLFENSDFNGDISGWDVSNVRDMSWMFSNAKFDGDISGWDVSGATTMSRMFQGAEFDGDISGWDVSNVRDMSWMFYSAKFNGDISVWDVSNVRDMSRMFQGSEFNGDISGWDVANVRDMTGMFAGVYIENQHKRKILVPAAFLGNISRWKVSKETNMSGMFSGSPILPHKRPRWYRRWVRRMGRCFLFFC